MTKRIRIIEGRKSKTFTKVARIETNTVGGSAMSWIPEDETNTLGKVISKNGEYPASKDKAYGYDKVVVNVPISTEKKTVRCTYGYDSDRVLYIVCQNGNKIMTQAMPSYLTIEPWTVGQANEMASAPDSWDGVYPFSVQLRTGDGEIYSEFESYKFFGDDYSKDISTAFEYEYSKKVKTDGEMVELAMNGDDDIVVRKGGHGTTLLTSYSRAVTAEDVSGESVRGRIMLLRAHPADIFAKPTWLDKPAEFLGKKVYPYKFVGRGRNKDSNSVMPWYVMTDSSVLCYVMGNYNSDEFRFIPVDNMDISKVIR